MEVVPVVGGVAVKLLRDAADVHAGAAERRRFGQDDPRTPLRRHPRGPHAAAAAAHHEEIAIESAHVHISCAARPCSEMARL